MLLSPVLLSTTSPIVRIFVSQRFFISLKLVLQAQFGRPETLRKEFDEDDGFEKPSKKPTVNISSTKSNTVISGKQRTKDPKIYDRTKHVDIPTDKSHNIRVANYAHYSLYINRAEQAE